jgi:heptosyltransferase-2
LVVRNDRFGEFLLNIPAIRALKETFPQAKLTVAVNPLVKELVDAVECVDQVVVWDESFRKSLRKQKFDLCVILNPTKEAHWAAFRAGIPIRLGYDRKWGCLLTHRLKDTKHIGNRHEVECNLELVGLVGAKIQDKAIGLAQEGSALPRAFRPRSLLPVPDNAKYEFLQGVVAIHPFTSDPVKLWPQGRFMELAQRITKELKLKVVLVGKIEIENSRDWPRPDGLGTSSGIAPSVASSPAAFRNDGIINMINKTSLVELAALLKRCSLLITCDSGPMHLACAVGTPVIALFRNDLPGKTAHRWGPWGKGHIVIEKSNLKDISVEEVMTKVKLKV